MRNIHLMLNKALADAAAQGHRRAQRRRAWPTRRRCRPPSAGEIKAWDADQLRTFLDAIAAAPAPPGVPPRGAHRDAPRRGARAAVVRLDLDAGRLSVRQALVSVAYDVQISDVKTGTGRRTIDLDAGTVDVLRGVAHRAQPRSTAASSRPTTSWCSPSPTASWIHPTVFSQIFDRKVAKLDVPTISLHDLRHTHATLLLKAGVPGEGRQRAPRPRQRRVHDERLPARPPRHAGRSRGHLRPAHLQPTCQAEVERDKKADTEIDEDVDCDASDGEEDR